MPAWVGVGSAGPASVGVGLGVQAGQSCDVAVAVLETVVVGGAQTHT